MQGHATRCQVLAGVLAPRGVRAGTDAGRTWAAEGHGRRLIFCAQNRTDPISGSAKNGDAPVLKAAQIPGSVDELPPEFKKIAKNRNPDYRHDAEMAFINAKSVA